MPRHPVKLTRGEIALPPRIAQKYRQRLEEMNAHGLQARNRGGVVRYMQEGGLLSGLPQGAVGDIGSALVRIGQHDYTGASDVLRGNPEADAKKLRTREERAQAYRDSIDAAAKATQYIDLGAGQVLDWISKSWSEVLSDSSWTEYISRITQASVGWVTGQQRQAVDAAAHELFGGTAEWNAYKLFTQEIRLLELKARSLVKGGSISDAEAQAAAETIVTD